MAKARDVLITIVVSVYNGATYIERCLKSILAQNKQDYRLIIIDDGSTDETYEMCGKIVKDLEHVRLVKVSHGGIGKVRNYGLALAETEYILFVDGDDYLSIDTVEILSSTISQNKTDLVVFGFWYETDTNDSHNSIRFPVSAKDKAYTSQQDIANNFVEIWDSGLMYSTVNKLFRVSKIREAGLTFENRVFGEDFKFCREYIFTCSSLLFVSRCCYHYICHQSGSLSTVYKPNLFDIRCKEHLDLTRYFESFQCYDDTAREFLARRHLERVVGCIENECSPYSKKLKREKKLSIGMILNDELTITTAKQARLKSIKMKILAFPIKLRWITITYWMGCVMSTCRFRFPQLFMWLKMHR